MACSARRYETIEVYPSPSTPGFRRVGLLPSEESSVAINFIDDLFVSVLETHVIAWNVVQDSWVKWYIDVDAESVRIVALSYYVIPVEFPFQLQDMQCVKCDGNLVSMKANVISVWQIPRQPID